MEGSKWHQKAWWFLYKQGVSQDFLCSIGLHHYTNEFVGLLHARCGNCERRIQVCTPYDYEPSVGRNKFDENGFLTYDK